MIQLTLYTTLGCHLCQQLEGLLGQLCREPVVLERVEISEDEGLMARYGVRIPVLADAAGSELDRGFEPERLAAWLIARGWLDETAWASLARELAGEDAPAPREVRQATLRRGRRYLG